MYNTPALVALALVPLAVQVQAQVAIWGQW